MAYDIKNVFYLDTELTMPTASGAAKSNTVQLDLSSYIDPIARGRSKGTGLAIYKVHAQVAGDTTGTQGLGTDLGAANYGLTVKPFTVSGDNITQLGAPDLSPASDLAIYLGSYTTGGTAVAGQSCPPMGQSYLEQVQTYLT